MGGDGGCGCVGVSGLEEVSESYIESTAKLRRGVTCSESAERRRVLLRMNVERERSRCWGGVGVFVSSGDVGEVE